MSKIKKVFISILAVIFIALATIGIVLLAGNGKKNEPKEDSKEMITIKFDANGGTEVDDLKIEKGETITIPETTKDDATFIGWFLGEELITEKTTFEEDVTLKAKWQVTEVINTPKTFTVSFNSNGGSKVSSIKVECEDKLPKLPTPTKDGYTFISWADKHGKVISQGAWLTCEDVTLYANWEKKESTTPEPAKKYTCPSGYTLDGTKCKMEKTAKKTCPTDTYEYQGKCITLTASAQSSDQVTRVCGKTTVVVDNNGHTEEVQGVVKYAGYYYCAYSEVNEGQSTCTSHSYKWIDGKCYRTTTGPSANITFGCKTDAYKYLSVAEVNSLRQNANMSGCFPASSKISYCDDGWTVSGSTCIKTIDATLE